MPPETLGSRPGSVVTGRAREARGATHNWPSVVRVRVWPVGKSLSHRAPATPVAGQAQCVLTKVARCMVFPLTHWCGLVGLCIGGRMTFNLRLSRARMGVVAKNNWIPQNWGEKGVKKISLQLCVTKQKQGILK